MNSILSSSRTLLVNQLSCRKIIASKIIPLGSKSMMSTLLSNRVPLLTTCFTRGRGIAEAFSDTVEENPLRSVIDTKIPFSQLGLAPELVESLKAIGFTTAFDIQAKTLPFTLNGRNVIGRAITGSGKTLAYALPIVHTLTSNTNERGVPRGLVITPTRELCRQVKECISNMGMGLRCVALYGGDPYSRQENELRRGVDVICATPGRLNDHIQRGTLSINKMKFLVLDEADELLTPNFKLQIENVLDTVPSTKQMMLFSATMPPDVKMLVQRYMPNPEIVNLTTSKSLVPPSITHSVIKVDHYGRFGVILDLLRVHAPKRCIVFTPRKVDARDLGSYLSRHGIRASSLHSDLSQNVRESCLYQFRNGTTKVIAATDVAARGIDVPEIDLVIQVEPPPSGVDFYIHRSGRTGRKGLPGKCILLATPSRNNDDFLRELRRVVKVTEGQLPPREDITQLCLEKAVENIKKFTPNEKLKSLAETHANELISTMNNDALINALLIMADVSRETNKSESYGRDRNYGEEYSSGQDYGGGYSRRDRDYGGGRRDRDYGGGRRGGDRGGYSRQGGDRGGRFNDRNVRNRGRSEDQANYGEAFDDLFS